MLDYLTATRNFLDYCRLQKRLSPKTLKAYGLDLHQLCLFLLREDIALDRACLERYIAELNGQYRPRTVKRKLASAKAFCSYLVYMQALTENPFAHLRLDMRQPLLLPRVIPLESIRRLITAAYGSFGPGAPPTVLRDIAVLELLFTTGARVSELCSLTPDDVELTDGTVRIYGKGARERFIQVRNGEALATLQRYRDANAARIAACGYFLVSRSGGRLSEDSVRRVIRKYTALAGVTQHITPHMFRHSFATLLLEEDVDIRYIQNMLGHSSITTTQIYTHVALGKQRAILEGKHPRNKFHAGFGM